MTTQESEHKQDQATLTDPKATPSKNGASSKQKPKKKRKKKRSLGQRALGSVAKWFFIIFCFVFSVIFGLVVGYSIIGEGSVGDVFNIGTWKHLYDLIFTR
ncbi:DNA-directed RNA polymerase subunit beta [Bacillus horti]|uniref:Flp pilus assembly protein TadB n=1 Tax=Caldalkalibacillus horti TaxID=77523 RepID=A0ABT9W0N4_9BACI|nr:DNA-directed RNA polymerase subunit beta [Bacillus horti]MDQ0166425.1 Flp pilus assembly protein TadB [Bacillus horti]